MRSYEEMAQNVFRRGDEYFRRKQKQAAFIKKGVSFMSITGIIIALGFVAGSSQLLSPAIPDEPQQIDLNTDITTTVVTSTAAVTGTGTSAVTTESPASAEASVTTDITTAAYTAITTTSAAVPNTTAKTTTAAVTTAAVTTEAASSDVNIYEEYTFDEFIQLSEEEICSISDEVSELYNFWCDQISGYDVTYIHFAMSVPYITTDENGQETADADSVKAALYLPEDMPVDYRCPLNDIEFIQYTIDCGNYEDFYENNYSTAITAATLVWIDANPHTGDFIDPEFSAGNSSTKSGTFGEIFSWSISDGTLAFTVDDSAKTGGDICLTTGLDYSEGNQAENRPWFSYIHDISHIVFDDAITSIGTDIVFDFMAINAATAIETVTCGENMRWDENIWAYYNDTSSAVLRAPKYSYSEYWAFYEKVPFEASGTAQSPYLKLTDEEGKWEYSEDTSTLTMHGNIDAESLISVSEMWYGRYDQVILSEDAECSSAETDHLITHVLAGGTLHKDMRRDDITVSCYSALGKDNISSIRDAGYTVVVLDGGALTLTGDADGNGTIDLSDAVKVLTIYAENASGLNRAIYGSTLDSAADVNSDGNIDLDDAVAILTYYAHNAAGLDPSWDAILAQ